MLEGNEKNEYWLQIILLEAEEVVKRNVVGHTTIIHRRSTKPLLIKRDSNTFTRSYLDFHTIKMKVNKSIQIN